MTRYIAINEKRIADLKTGKVFNIDQKENNEVGKNFYVYEVIEDHESIINTRKYKKGERFIGFDVLNSACFNLIDDTDFIPLKKLKKIRKVEFIEC